jgi:hypothetical protein
MKLIKLNIIREKIINNNFLESAKKQTLFGGADISILSEKPAKKDNLYNEPQYVVTKYSKELSWLIFELKDVFKENLNYFNKYSFYGRLAEKANKSIELNGDNLNQLLLDVLDEAEIIAKEME